MSTYSTLRDRALDQVGCTGQTEAQTIAQVALEEAMKFVAFHVRIPSLVASATATAPSDPQLEASAIALTGGAGTFGISTGVFQCPDTLWVKKDSSTVGYGTPYEFYEYNTFLALKAIPSGRRIGVLDNGFADERADFSWTITPTDKVWSEELVEDNVLTLFYRKSPAAYSGAATPEITPLFDYILVNAAVLALKEWLREPAELTTMWGLFEQGLMADVQRYDSFINGRRKRSHLRIHRSYRP
jgi:hypothetical protein